MVKKEPVFPERLAEEYNTLRDFLQALAHHSEQKDVSLTIVSWRHFHGGMMRIEAGIWLHFSNAGSRCSCFVLAAEASLVAGRGRCIFPVKEAHDHPQVIWQLQQRCTELMVLLTELLSRYPFVHIRSARAALPLSWTWERPGEDLPLRFQEGYWTLVPEERTPCSPGSAG